MTVTSDVTGVRSEPEPVDSAGRSPAAAPSLLAVSHLNRSYGSRRAVHDVTFELRPGITGLLGPNGAGKSSLLTCLAGIAGWDDGRVHIAGVDLARHPNEGRRRVGYMPERVAFPAEMRVEEYLRFVSTVKGIRRADRAAAIEPVLERAGLADVRGRVIGNLSKGYRQRVGLAQALLGEPPVVILDEPTAGLDPLSVLEIRDLLTEYARGRVVLVSTHHLPDARLMCDRVLVLSRGAVVYDGAPAGMAVRSDGALRVRIRIREDGGEERVLLFDAANEEALGMHVRELATRGLVVGVEPTMDVLEDAFKRAVLSS
jgi:ABC-2 type transport system ATP-binding protein